MGFLLGYFIDELIIKNEKPAQNIQTITGEAIQEPKEDYTYTTAICNQNKECIDVLVECSGGNVASLTPTSKLIDLGDDFEDFRDPQEQFCE